MSRYSLNLRPIYAPDEQTGSSKLAAGINAALEAYRQREDEKRAEENQMVLSGATQNPDAPRPSMIEQARGIGSRIKRIFTGDEDMDPTDADDRTPAAIARGVAGAHAGALPMNVPLTPPFVAPSPRVTPPGVGPGIVPALDASARIAQGVAGAQAGPVGTPAPRLPSQQALDAARPMISRALDGAADGAIAPQTIRGKFHTYTVDPLYKERVAIAGKELDEERQVAALVAAGEMSEADARARVRTHTLGYDPEYGRQTGRLTFEQQKELAMLRAMPRSSMTPEQRDRMLDLQERRLGLSERAADTRDTQNAVGNELRVGAAARADAKPVNPLTAGTSAESPADKAKREKAAREATGHTATAASIARNARATPDQIAKRAGEIATQNPNMSDADIRAQMRREGYPTTTPRR